MKYLDKLNEADQRAYAAAENAWARYSVLKYTLSKDELAELYGPAPVVTGHQRGLVLEDWAPLVEKATGEETGYVRRVKGRPLSEICEKLSEGLESAGLRIDEYFGISADAECSHKLETWPEGVVEIMVYAVVGGSEGHYVHVDVLIRQDWGRPNRIGMFTAKTFLGMEHALRLSNELTRMLQFA
jgi:hypothetical protein